ncbi:hypothetical protein [Bradyrhizobium sp.]|uniref:hypothetical protein n=1 Tax=Bradyrhizobium sp. TaxID=376 RepID=UPI003C562237
MIFTVIMALARAGRPPYLGLMGQPLSTPQNLPDRTTSGPARFAALHPAGKGLPVAAMAGAGLGALVMLGALSLWFHYGTTVFFEMVASGLSACF